MSGIQTNIWYEKNIRISRKDPKYKLVRTFLHTKFWLLRGCTGVCFLWYDNFLFVVKGIKIEKNTNAKNDPTKCGKFMTFGCYKTAEILHVAAMVHQLTMFLHFKNLRPERDLGQHNGWMSLIWALTYFLLITPNSSF